MTTNSLNPKISNDNTEKYRSFSAGPIITTKIYTNDERTVVKKWEISLPQALLAKG